jgi:hypothetical protein
MEKRKLERNAPHQKYITSSGEEVPGGSTICKLGDDPGALIHWAWNLGVEGKDYRKERDQAANIGTIAHFMCEAFLNEFVCDLSEYDQADIDKALLCYNKFVDWWEGEGLEKVATETQLVHDEMRYGGTIDLVAKDKNGNLVLIDIKTSKRLSDSYTRQIAGYTELWNFNQTHGRFEEPSNQIARWIIVRIGKQEEGDFEVKEFTEDHIWASINTFSQQVQLYWAIQAEKSAKPKAVRKKRA